MMTWLEETFTNGEAFLLIVVFVLGVLVGLGLDYSKCELLCPPTTTTEATEPD